MQRLSYGSVKKVRTGFAETLSRVKEELGKEGFGVLTEIDVKETFSKKLDVRFRPYRILGACNPVLARKALEVEPEIGLLLPCGVVVQEETDGTGVSVSVASPEAMFSLVDNPKLAGVAGEVAARLKRVLDAV